MGEMISHTTYGLYFSPAKVVKNTTNANLSLAKIIHGLNLTYNQALNRSI